MANWHIFLLVSILSFDWTISEDTEVRQPPLITWPIKLDLYNSAGSDVAVNCSATGEPKPTYSWRKNGTTIIPDQFITFDSVTGVLRIPSMSLREQATYMCTATNTPGGNRVVSFSPPIRLFQTRIEMADKETPVGHTVAEHAYLKMQCKTNAVVAASVNYNWYRDNKISIDLNNYRLYVDLTGNLHFTYVVLTDKELNYMCGISAFEDNVIFLGALNTVTVERNSNISPIKPQAVFTNTGVQGIRFSNAKLECMFSGYDPQSPYIPKITWRDDSGTIIMDNDKYSLSPDNRVLTVKNLQEEDEKIYECSAINSAGEAKAQVFLNVTSGPIFINGLPKDQTIAQHTDVQFNCDTRSASREEAPSTPVWFINGIPWGSQIDPNKLQLSDDQKILTVKNVTKPNDIMCVQCSVSNSVDTVLANACLNVLLPITIERQPKLEQSIVYGENVDLTVTASADKAMTLSYRWEFNNINYTGTDHPPHMFYDPNTNLAYINTSRLSQDQYGEIGGTYRRVVYHLYETKVVEINVILRDRQSALTAGGFDLWIIGLIIAILLLIIIILLIIFCICRKRQEGDYNVDKKETGAGLDPEKELKEKEFNAYSRPVYDEYSTYPDTKPPGDPEYDDAPIGGDDESLGEYGKEDVTYFNEDGSFIGIYQSKKSPPPQPTESTI